MPVAILTSKGQMTIPKKIRQSLHLKPFDKVIVVVEGEQAIIKPLRGSILDIGGSIKIPEKEKPIDFHKVREEVIKRITKNNIVKRAE